MWGLHTNTYTIETVLKGHPDKVCDQICDALLDEYLAQDKNAHVAVECLGSGTTLVLAGEVKSSSIIDIEKIAHREFRKIGYTQNLDIINKVNIQSNQLSQTVQNGTAGDQGIMYGYACENASNYLPQGIQLVNELAKSIDLLRLETNAFLPDGKVQVTISDSVINTLIISVQHSPDSDLSHLKQLIESETIATVLPSYSIESFLFNYNSNFVDGGFTNDTGLSGRKIILDTYCGLAPHGGGSFSGKDPTKVDRSGAYMARYVAKNVVANGLAKTCTVTVAYAFGLEEPVMITVHTDDYKSDKKILELVKLHFDFRPRAIIERLDLTNISYQPTSIYGHFTNPEYTWERIIKI